MPATLLFLPGSLCDARLFSSQIAHLESEYEIMVADLTAYDCVEQMAEHVLSQAPATFALAGLSLGGIVALEIMSQAPQRVTRLALLDTNCRAMLSTQLPPRQQEIELVSKGGEAALLELVANNYYPLYVSQQNIADQSLKDIVLDMVRVAGVQTMMNQWQAIIERPDYSELLPTLSCPILVLCGEHDVICDVALHRFMAQQITSSTLEVIPDCGHLSTLEAPTAVNEALDRWLK